MIKFSKYVLGNGLRLLIHRDTTTPMAVTNLLYDVGAKDEDADKTGFAHLFEHLMFGGSVNIPRYDEPLQRVGGENNAFTTNDLTNYYIQVPAVNLETAFWLESDRMLSLAFSEQSLNTQRNVVCEEFKQRYLNQPYGDVWLRLRPLAYKTHPYQWATIGKDLKHIENATMADVKAFFNRYYHPANAILVVAGHVKEEEVLKLTEKWFGSIPAGKKLARQLPQEPVQQAYREETVRANVPLNALYRAYHMCARKDAAYYTQDIISDILSRGNSSRFFTNLIKEKKLFSEVNAYISNDLDPGLFIIEGKLINGVSMEEAEQAVDEELRKLATEEAPAQELQKVKNKIESAMIFGEMGILNKAMSLAYFELLGDAGRINTELDKYLSVTAADIKREAAKLFRKSNCSTLYYLANEYQGTTR